MTTQSPWSEALHPRDGHGRFAQEAPRLLTEIEKAVGNRASALANPKRFNNDSDASEYLTAHAPHTSNEEADAVNRYTGDLFFDLNKKLRAGDATDPEVARLDAAMRPLPDDLVLTRHVQPEAFGLRPVDLHAVESLAGHKVSDPAYSSTALGSPYGGGIGGVTMHILAPKGTPAVFASVTSRNPHEREVLLGRGAEYAVAKVVRNARYGYDMYVVVLPKEGR